MTIAAVSPLEVSHPAGWKWQPETRRYRDPSTGRFTSNATVKAWRDTFLDRRQGAVRDLSAALSAGWITSGSWREQMGEIQRETYGIMAALGRGGLDAMQPEDWNRVNAQLARQQPYLERFANQVEEGNLSEDQIGARSELYIGSAVQAFEAGRAAAWGDPDLPQLPGDGNTECGGNCRCHWDINPTETAWECSWTGTNDERTCMGCANNQDTWDPLIVPYPEPALLGPPLPPGASVRSELLAPPPPVGTVVSGETLTWTQTKAGKIWVDASGRFMTSYERGWQLIDSQTGAKEAFKTLRLAMQKAEALVKTPPPVVPPVVHPTIIEKPTVGREVEINMGIRNGWQGTIVSISGNWAVVRFSGGRGQGTYHVSEFTLRPANTVVATTTIPPEPKPPETVIWDKKNANYISSRNVLWKGIPRFELQYRKGWILTDNMTGEQGRFRTSRLAQEHAAVILHIATQKTVKTETPEPESTGNPAAGKYVRIKNGDRHVGETGQVIYVESPPGGTQQLWVRFADLIVRVPFTSGEVVKRPAEYPPEIVNRGMHIGSQVEMTARWEKGEVATIIGIVPVGENIQLWSVILMGSGGYTFQREFKDIKAYTPPPPPPAEIKITADEAIAKLRSIESDQQVSVGKLHAVYTVASLAERSYMQLWSQEHDMRKIPAIAEEWGKAVDRVKLARAAYEKAVSGLQERVREELLYHEEPAQIKVHFKSTWDPGVRAEIDRGIDGFKRMVGRGRLDGLDIDFTKTREGRSFYQSNTVNLSPRLRPGATVVHELGHWLEDRNSVAADLIQADYAARTKGETAVSLRSVYPNSNYDPSEMTKQDKFRDAYMGKVYFGARAHELLSMGMEQMYGDPLGLLNQDEATFRVVWEVLHSGSHVVPSSGQAIEKKKKT